jgi:hypothetical protein
MKEYCNQDSVSPLDLIMTKRQFLSKFGMGMGMLGATSLFEGDLSGAQGVATHFPSKAKHIIHIFFSGGQSHIDTWDPKPKLVEMDGQPLPGMGGLACGSPFKFNKCGKSGIEVSEVFSKIGQHIDHAAVLRGMTTDVPAHETATIFMNTGNLRLVRPSLGSWVVYGLGSGNDNLPAFISLRSGGMPTGGTQNFGSSFLPGMYQGTPIDTSLGSVDKMIQNIKSQYASLKEQRSQLDTLSSLNEIHRQNFQKDEAFDARIQSFELAFKMQTEATDVFDISKESQSVRDSYGTTSQGKQMLIARRLVEKGVRFVQVWTGGWDTHDGISRSLKNAADQVDGPIAALIQDLKSRGLLDSTLIVMTGEFGRTPARDGVGGANGFGRSHWNRAMSSVLVGGGVKGGTVYGATDEFGGQVVEDKMSVHDLHATILRLTGYDHKKLSYRYNGRDFRLTDVFGEVATKVIA